MAKLSTRGKKTDYVAWQFWKYPWRSLSIVTTIVASVALFMALVGFDKGYDVAKPIAQDIGVIGSRCPSGWADTSEQARDTSQYSCYNEDTGWVVILNRDESFNHAFQLDNPSAGFIEDEDEVPNW